MSNKIETVWEEPVDDSTEESIAEEFRFRPHRLIRVKPEDRNAGVRFYLDEYGQAQFQKAESLKEETGKNAA